MTPSAQTAGGRRVRRWTRELIIEKILEWEARYGEPPCSADWNPSLARWRAQEWRAERYREGVWPSTNAAKRPFGGSFDAAVRAAGLVPHRPGPRRRNGGPPRPAPEQLDGALRAALERARGAEARVAALEQRLLAAEQRAVLRVAGPAGPAVLADALKGLVRARAAGDRGGLRVALGEVAAAAVGWRDRL
jgi:hypothetical protein